MSEAGNSSSPAPAGRELEALRQRGAERFDAVGFRFLEALARRAGEQEGAARRRLDGRLALALQAYGERFEQMERQARESLAGAQARHPDAAKALQGLFDSADFKGLASFAAGLEDSPRASPLAELVAYIGQHCLEGPDAGPSGQSKENSGAPAELKSLGYFRETWSKLSVEQQLNQAIARVPDNAGPLNSHLLVLRALKQMRDISPAYLNRFMTYVEALLWLDQAEGPPSSQRPGARGDGERKRKSGRGKAG